LSDRREIFVALSDEAVDVWRPVTAERVDVDSWRVLGPMPADEVWEFRPGEIVQLELRTLSGGEVPVAVRSREVGA
jgi:hypothetical protein